MFLIHLACRYTFAFLSKILDKSCKEIGLDEVIESPFAVDQSRRAEDPSVDGIEEKGQEEGGEKEEDGRQDFEQVCQDKVGEEIVQQGSVDHLEDHVGGLRDSGIEDVLLDQEGEEQSQGEGTGRVEEDSLLVLPRSEKEHQAEEEEQGMAQDGQDELEGPKAGHHGRGGEHGTDEISQSAQEGEVSADVLELRDSRKQDATGQEVADVADLDGIDLDAHDRIGDELPAADESQKKAQGEDEREREGFLPQVDEEEDQGEVEGKKEKAIGNGIHVSKVSFS